MQNIVLAMSVNDIIEKIDDWVWGQGCIVLEARCRFFAFTTILGWDYYSERCVEYLTGNQKVVKVYKYIYILAVFIGHYLMVSAVWNMQIFSMVLWHS